MTEVTLRKYKFATLANFVEMTSNEFGGFAFRGQSNIQWALVPGIDRLPDGREHERELLETFKNKAQSLLDSAPTNDWDWLALAQYSGIPTRLLDWSRNPLVALFFAVSRNSEADSAVWAYRHVGRMRLPRVSPFQSKRTVVFETSLALLVRVARYGIYTAQPSGSSLGSSGTLVQIRVPRAMRSEIRHGLEAIGINHDTLFPGIPNILSHADALEKTSSRSARGSISAFKLLATAKSHHPKFDFDVFVSYASEDREFTAEIVAKLRRRGVRVWFDQTEVHVGDSLTAALDRGLARSRYGVVIVSKAYISKHWTIQELKGLLQREADEGDVVLPIWRNIDHAAVKAFSVTFSDKVALRSPQLSTTEIVRELVTVVRATESA